MNESDRKVPAALVLPAGKFFFGFKYTPYDSTKVAKTVDVAPSSPKAFSGEGTTLKRRLVGSSHPGTDGRNVLPALPVKEEQPGETSDPWARLGGGNKLSSRGVKKDTGPAQAEVIDATMLDEDDFGFGDEGEEYDDVIEIDSD